MYQLYIYPFPFIILEFINYTFSKVQNHDFMTSFQVTFDFFFQKTSNIQAEKRRFMKSDNLIKVLKNYNKSQLA